MENNNFECYRPVEIALKGVGLKVDEVMKQEKKTVIIVSPYKGTNKDFLTSEKRWERRE